jgi:hypothetical protein
MCSRTLNDQFIIAVFPQVVPGLTVGCTIRAEFDEGGGRYSSARGVSWRAGVPFDVVHALIKSHIRAIIDLYTCAI